jgi:hypothetical protein
LLRVFVLYLYAHLNFYIMSDKDEVKLLVQSGKTRLKQPMTQATLDALRKQNPTAEFTVLKENVKPAEAQAAAAKTRAAVGAASAAASTSTDAATDSAKTDTKGDGTAK